MEDAARILREQFQDHPSMYHLTLLEVERAVLQEHLYRLCDGKYQNLQIISDVLGISRHTLRRKMQKHGFKCVRVESEPHRYILLVGDPE